MDRRTTLKSILILGLVSVASFPIFRWFSITKKPDLNFLNTQKVLIEELSEMIIPKTDTPGAKEAKVVDFIIKTVVNCLDVKDQNNFISGLQELEDYSMKEYQSFFANCNAHEKVEVLTHFEQRDNYANAFINKVSRKLQGAPFFVQLKEMTVNGYCTSEIGAKNGLAYDYIPVYYEACIPIHHNQKSWATK